MSSHNQVNAHLIDSEVESLLTKGAIAETTPIREGFFSRLFLVPKKGGTFRPVIDLSFLNKFVENSHFQMESIHCLKSLLQKGDYMTTLDLKDAYLSVPVHKDSQKFLQFLWRNKCYAFQGLCFGLNTAPRIFTKLLKPVAAFLRKQGVRMILYLDDFLILGSTYQEAQSHTAMAVTLLESLGFTINQEKSCLIPTQIITFLGFVIDSTVETLSLPQEKVVKVKSLCMKATLTPTMPARQIASLLGTLEACRPAIWQAPLHFRHLQIRMIHALHANNQNFDVNLTLDHNPLEELRWWVSNIDSVNGSPIRPPAPTLFITTDASKTGWGAVCETQRTNGRWSVSERTQHINVLELKAAFLALKSFLKNYSHKVVCLRMDNTTAVAHVNNKGGTHSPCLLTLTLELWQWCLERNIMISAQHVPGRLNTIADSESRVFNDSSEWKIDSQTISPFLKGCEIDLFASRLSAQLPKYVSWRLDPEALQADALTMDWAPFKGYAFPPFNLIPAVLNKVTQDKADIILVAPIWPAQPWWPLLLSLLVKQPVLLPSSRHLLRDPTDPRRIHPMFPRLHLAVFHVSGDNTRLWEFQTTLPRYSFQHPAHLQGKHINQLGDAGVAGVLRERLILFQRL